MLGGLKQQILIAVALASKSVQSEGRTQRQGEGVCFQEPEVKHADKKLT